MDNVIEASFLGTFGCLESKKFAPTSENQEFDRYDLLDGTTGKGAVGCVIFPRKILNPLTSRLETGSLDSKRILLKNAKDLVDLRAREYNAYCRSALRGFLYSYNLPQTDSSELRNKLIMAAMDDLKSQNVTSTDLEEPTQKLDDFKKYTISGCEKAFLQLAAVVSQGELLRKCHQDLQKIETAISSTTTE